MIDFPGTPLVGQIMTLGPLAWRWDGTKWTGGGAGPIVQMAPNMLQVIRSVALPATFAGFVRVENNTSAPITLLLPASPTSGQKFQLKDCYGNAGTYPVTVTAQGGKTIEGQSSLMIYSNYGWLDLIYTGVQWVQA